MFDDGSLKGTKTEKPSRRKTNPQLTQNQVSISCDYAADRLSSEILALSWDPVFFSRHRQPLPTKINTIMYIPCTF